MIWIIEMLLILLFFYAKSTLLHDQSWTFFSPFANFMRTQSNKYICMRVWVYGIYWKNRGIVHETYRNDIKFLKKTTTTTSLAEPNLTQKKRNEFSSMLFEIILNRWSKTVAVGLLT